MARSKPSPNAGRAALAVALLAIALLLVWRQISPPRPAPVIRSAYYYDLDAGRLFVDGSDKVPPFTTDGGAQAVAAHVYSCSTCTEPEQFIAFLTRYDEATRSQLAAMTLEQRTYGGVEVQMLIDQGQQIRAFDGERWAPFSSEAGMNILQSPPLRCGGIEAPVTACDPPSID